MHRRNPALHGSHVLTGGPLALAIQGVGSPVITGVPRFLQSSDTDRIGLLRQIVDEHSMDPRLRVRAMQIVRAAGAPPRDYQAQAKALLAWVQHHIYYTHEMGEQIQAPARTLEWGTGDCDDSAVLLAALAQAIGVQARFVLAGRTKAGQTIRWIEGEGKPPTADYYHIYCQLGWPWGRPRYWLSAEPTIQGAPLGYDMVVHGVKVDSHGRASVPPPGWMQARARAASHGQSGGGTFYGATTPTGEATVEAAEGTAFFSKEYLQKLTLTAFEAVIIATAVALGTRYLGVKG